MDNHYKLILIVLTFFLALTFVQETYAVESKEVVFNGNNAITLILSSPNPLPSRATPGATLYGPFTVESITGNEPTNQNGTASIAVTLKPIAGLHNGDVYTGKALIRWGTEVQEVPLRIRADNSFTGSPGTGFVIVGLGQNVEIILNLILVIVIIMLIFGLATRIQKRLEGN